MSDERYTEQLRIVEIEISFGRYTIAKQRLLNLIQLNERKYSRSACIRYWLGIIHAQICSSTSIAQKFFMLAYFKKPYINKYKLALLSMNINKINIGIQLYMMQTGSEVADMIINLIDIDIYLARGYSSHYRGYDLGNIDNNVGYASPHLKLINHMFLCNTFNISTYYIIISNVKNRVYQDGYWLLNIKFDATSETLNINVKFETMIIHPYVDDKGYILKSVCNDFLQNAATVHDIVCRIKSLLNNIEYINDYEIINHTRQFATKKSVYDKINNMNLICLFNIRRYLYSFTKLHYNESFRIRIKKIITIRYCKILEQRLSIIIPTDVCNIISMFYFVKHKKSNTNKLLPSYDFSSQFYELTGNIWHAEMIYNK